ncbi:phage tail protein [Moellerella wisconsensis]|uniref:phage tail protein n=1 Tax=Moellerella wisconsensis TaxID=158849 RepID=UPI0030767FE0
MKYFALLTKLGENLLAQATALGTKLELTHMAVGDGGGSLPTPDTNQTKLVKEQRRAAINTLFIDEKNPNQIIAEQIIPESEGGWFIREIGLFDKAGNLIAVANCPETYKPQLTEGSGRTQAIRMVLIVSHTESVTLKIDPSVVLATREYVDDSVKNAIEVHAKSRKHPDASTSAKGFVQLSDVLSTDNSKAITPKLATEINQRAISAQASANAANTAATNANNNANGRVPSGRKINNKSLVADISLTAGDVGAYTKTETDSKVADAKKAGVDAQVTANAANTAATNANNNANGRVPNSRKVNNKPLSNDINLTASDIGAQPKGDYATKTDLTSGLNQKFDKTGGQATGPIIAPSFTVKYDNIKNAANLYPPPTESGLAYIQYSKDKEWFGRLEIPRVIAGTTGQLISSIDLEQGTNTSLITVYKDGSYYPMLKLKRSDGTAVHLEAKPDDQPSLAQLYRRNAAGQIDYNISFPKRTGTLAIDGDSYTKTESDSLIIGLNQKWVDVKSSRDIGTTYTNTTGKPIMVAISVLLIGGGSGLASMMKIDNVDFVFKGGGADSSGTWKGSAISMIIPANAKYKLESAGQIDSWVELRV